MSTPENEDKDLEVVVGEADKVAASPDEKPKDLELDIVDDTPEGDRNKQRRPEGVEPDLPEDSEIEKYSESVQKRIKKLKYEFHEERRQKEEAQRIRDEAVRVAQEAFKRHEEIRQKYSAGEKVLVDQAKNRNEAELARAKDLYKKAFEAGDADKLAEAQEVIARLAAEKRDIETYRPQELPQMEAPKPQAPRPSQKAEEWAKSNTWFMQDRDMTNYAFVVDERLKRQGVAPDSDEYYEKLNASLKKEFPDRFSRDEAPSKAEVSQPRKQGPVVAPTSRSQANSPRRITLTKSQVELARRLGISPEGYAKQLLKLEGKE